MAGRARPCSSRRVARRHANASGCIATCGGPSTTCWRAEARISAACRWRGFGAAAARRTAPSSSAARSAAARRTRVRSTSTEPTYSPLVDEISALTEQQAELSDLLAPLDDDDWSRPSRCEGWSVADVVLHLAQTNEMAIGSAQRRFTEALADPHRGRGGGRRTSTTGPTSWCDTSAALPQTVLRDRWQQSADALRAALTDVDPHERVDWVAGQLSARTLTTTRLAETWIHTGDVADALGVTLVPANASVTSHAWRGARFRTHSCAPVACSSVRSRSSCRTDLVACGRFVPDDHPATTIRGDGVELCLVAARRVDPAADRPRRRGSGRGGGPRVGAHLRLSTPITIARSTVPGSADVGQRDAADHGQTGRDRRRRGCGSAGAAVPRCIRPAQAPRRRRRPRRRGGARPRPRRSPATTVPTSTTATEPSTCLDGAVDRGAVRDAGRARRYRAERRPVAGAGSQRRACEHRSRRSARTTTRARSLRS